jgi:acetyl esterase/lipase
MSARGDLSRLDHPDHHPDPSAGSAHIRRRYALDDGTPVEVVENGPSLAGRLAWLGARLAIRPAVAIGVQLSFLPWPWGLVDRAARALPPIPGTVRTTVHLPNCDAQFVRAKDVLPADGTRRVVVYFHGGGFLTCGVNTHARLVTMISRYADAPVLVVNYRMMPKHSLAQAIDDCQDGYYWLRELGYGPEQIVLAGDSAGGYLALALAERLLANDEQPAAMVSMSPLMQLDGDAKKSHPNIHSDALFAGRVFGRLADLIATAAARHAIDGKPEDVFEPLDHVEPGLPNTLIHVSGSEVLLHDARLAARKLANAGVPVEVRVWPGQMHVFQLCFPFVPEAIRSLRQIGAYIQEATG